MSSDRFPRPARRAFSLVELLVVIAILGLLLVFSMPALQSLNGGLDLTRAADLVNAQLSLARQTAISRNRTVEVRFYSYPRDGGPPRIRAVQPFVGSEEAEGAWQPLMRPQYLPQRICLDSGMALSPLLASQTNRTGPESGVALPGIGMSYTYSTISFRPDGSVDLPAGADFATLKAARLDDPLSQLPENYAIIQVSPVSGRQRTYRP